MKICPDEVCTACSACVNSCPTQALSLSENAYGELHPLIENKKCISCGLCQRVCPNNSQMTLYAPRHCYASWISDKAMRAECASGGIATAISEFFIANKGVVFGTAYDSSMTPCIIETETVDALDKLKGSKYVQSLVGNNTFQKVKRYLDDNRNVLFIGTPCQIAGLLAFLKEPYDNLTTIDLLCHGVCPTSYFMDEIEILKQKHQIESIANIRFRGNDDDNSKMTFYERLIGRYNSNNFRFSVWNHNEAGLSSLCYRGDQNENYYLAGFLLGVTLRENCYSCRYAKPKRIGDITLGDFIHIGQSTPFEYPAENVSVVLVNTAKGETVFKAIANMNTSLHVVERTLEERTVYKYSILEPFPRHRLNPKFRALYAKYGYEKAIKKTLGPILLWSFLKTRLIHFTHLPIYAISNLIKSGHFYQS